MNYPEPGMPDLRLVLSEEATNDQPEAPELLELRGVKKRAAEIILEAAEVLRRNDIPVQDDLTAETITAKLKDVPKNGQVEITISPLSIDGIRAHLMMLGEKARFTISFHGEIGDARNPERRRIAKILKDAGIHLQQELV